MIDKEPGGITVLSRDEDTFARQEQRVERRFFESDSEPFCYVDTATNGARNRNRVMKLSDYHPPSGAVDCFTTYLRFTEELKDYAEGNLNPRTGRPSVSGYPGPALAEFLPFDFDDKEDPAKAVAEAVYFVRKWQREWRVPPETLRIYFSGMKGVSIEVPAELFGGFEPSREIADWLRHLAIKMAPGAKTLDTSIYEKMRLWRVPNTRHGGRRFYKVQLTTKEFLDGHND